MLLPETYGPVILKKRARRLRKETGNPSIFAPIELEKKGAKQILTITLTRPLRMLVFEAIVLFTSLYLAFAYAIFYMFFEAYPIIFEGEPLIQPSNIEADHSKGIYGMGTGVSALPFIPSKSHRPPDPNLPHNP